MLILYLHIYNIITLILKLICTWIILSVPPKIHIPKGLVGAPLNSDAKLKCEVEAFPVSHNRWLKNGEDVLKNGYYFKI